MDNDSFLTTTAGSTISISGSATTNAWIQPSWGVQAVDREKVTLIKRMKLFGITLSKKLVEIPVDKFFERMKKDKLKIQIIDKIVDKYMSSIERAELAGQTALVEKLKDSLEVVKMETKICQLGVSDYLTKKHWLQLTIRLKTF